MQTAFAATGAVLVLSGSARIAWCLARVIFRTWQGGVVARGTTPAGAISARVRPGA